LQGFRSFAMAEPTLQEWERQQEGAFVGWINSLLRQHESGLVIERVARIF
jgi:hypothetical protein